VSSPVPGGLSAGLASRLRWTAADAWILIRRELWHLRNQPGQLVSALIFPVALVVLFGYVFGSAITVPGGGDYRAYLMPGLFAMTAAFAVLINAMAIAAEKSKGVMDRFRSMPMARLAVPFGQTGADIITGTAAALVMAVCGLAVGWRPHDGAARAVAAFALILLFRYAVSWAGVYLGLALKDDKTVDNLAPLIFPLTMIANTFVPTAHMPAWLRAIADWNPVSAVTAASRQLFGNPGAPAAHAAWPLQHPVPATLAWSAALLAAFATLSVRRFAASGN
jgi:ABC-2 type transport system permease protein